MELENSELHIQYEKWLRRKRRLRLLLLAVLPLVAAATASYILYGHSTDHSEPAQAGSGPVAPKITAVETIVPSRQMMPAITDVQGIVGQAPEIPITLPQVSKVLEVRVKQGQRVKAGEVIAVVEPLVNAAPNAPNTLGNTLQSARIAQTQVAAAQNNLSSLQNAANIQADRVTKAQSNLEDARERLKQATALRDSAAAEVEKLRPALEEKRTLHEQGVISDNDLKAAENEFQLKQTELKTAETSIEDAESSIKAAEEELAAERKALDRAKAALKRATSNVQAGTEALNKYRKQIKEASTAPAAAQGGGARMPVSSQYDGMVLEVKARPGMLLTPAMTVVIIKVTGIAVVTADISQAEVAKLKKGMNAMVRLPKDGKELPAQVEGTGISPTSAPGMAQLMLSVRDAEGKLKPDMKVTARLMLGQAPMLAVPSDAIVSKAQGGPCVWVVEDGAAKLRKVTIMHQNAQAAAISEGIEPDDIVIVRTSARLRDGMRVRTTGSQFKVPEQKAETFGQQARPFP